jgi:tellurite resistance protein TerC
VLAGVMDKFVYLKLGLSAILVFVGAKMLLTEVYKIPATVSLLVVVSMLAITIVASMRKNRREERMAADAA